MPYYYLNQNQQDNGDYEIHEDNCYNGAAPQNRIALGFHPTCALAIKAATEKLGDEIAESEGTINGCYYCCNECHIT